MLPYRQVLYDLAENQHGYLTAAQAKATGVPAIRLVQMVKEGTVERISHGVYRLTRFPSSQLAQYMEATLWPAPRRTDIWGVLSHESALAFYELSEVSPAKVHITVPPTVRIRRVVPRYLVLHRAQLDPSDVTVIDGIHVTSVERTIRDVAAAHLSSALVRAAIADGRRLGRLTAAQAERLTEDLLRTMPSRHAEAGSVRDE